jgi:hypothetical protein
MVYMSDAKMVRVGVSPKQMSKLRNGRRVRIRPAMEGEGVCMVVSPENYSLITRTFSRNKGMDISLSPQEIVANQEASAEMEGQGIFGKKFDKLLKKAGIKKMAYEVGDVIKPLAKAGITAGLTAGATALGATNPALAPYLPAGVAGLSGLAYDYLDRPGKYQSNAGGSRAKLARTLAGRVAQDVAMEQLNEALGGTNLGDLSRASLADALANKAQEQVAQMSSYDRYMMDQRRGSGLYLGVSSGRGVSKMSKTGGAIGLNAGMVKTLPPALQSQPFSANFQFQHTLPPSYQKFSRGSGLSL